ncbi:LuxR C-terminal-related transcriptional regulator [Streptomyces spinosirectus]|jgi:DNA-binding NarL/FixJ family response regulator|uniref:helix-turn-helix transcriptional regulator n=1 Tax=Streptomyces TaxID=1883 RepID=UPI001C9D87B2|nr:MULTISPECIES: LuxR C-terminal-related transcriptional regulator [Streptomyces]MBY8343054.1 helix-turn-helix transcriptional regulator [Streptomyces plumbidurans]UIR19154.1 LuxR C-terminal-related transcriptional regulator [Streptomyces spinosirectus]
MSPATHPDHGPEDLCRAGLDLYGRALREGQVSSADADASPCLVAFGLLRPCVTGTGRLEPVAPAVALHRLLRTSADRIAGERQREQRLVETFEPLMSIGGQPAGTAQRPDIDVVGGLDRINEAIAEAMADARHELLAIQPYDGRSPAERLAKSLGRDQDLLDRGGRIRTLYQHTQRYSPAVTARYEQLTGDAEARTLDQITERLIVIDRTVAFIPANADRTLALAVRHPVLIEYFATTFDRLWHLATPMHPTAATRAAPGGFTPRQRAIAALLVEGHTDTDIAERLGMNVRTARVHIAKLAATLGSESRAQLGYLIGRSGILDREG